MPIGSFSLDIVIYFKSVGVFEIIIILILFNLKNSPQIYCARRHFRDHLGQWFSASYFKYEDMESPEKLSALLKVTQLVSSSKFAVDAQGEFLDCTFRFHVSTAPH